MLRTTLFSLAASKLTAASLQELRPYQSDDYCQKETQNQTGQLGFFFPKNN